MAAGIVNCQDLSKKCLKIDANKLGINEDNDREAKERTKKIKRIIYMDYVKFACFTETLAQHLLSQH